MRIFKDSNGHLVIDGEGQIINTGIFVESSITSTANSVIMINFNIVSEENILEMLNSEGIIEERVEERIKEIIEERLVLKNFIMDPLSKRFELLDLGE